MEKRYSSTENLVCGQCHGEGQSLIPSAISNHHTGEREGGSKEVCPLCKGSGIVCVKKETVVTITPKIPRQ